MACARRGRAGDRSRAARAGRIDPVPPCLTPTRPGSTRIWTRRWTWPGRPGTFGRSAMWSRAGGGWCSLVSMVVGGGRRPRRGCAAVLGPTGGVNCWTWRMRSAATSPEPSRKNVRRHGAIAIRYHRRRCRLTSVRCVGPLPASTARMSLPDCERQLAPLAQSVERIHGKEKPGAYSPRSLTSRNSRLCRSMMIVASGSSSSE
jgi:hypothetical protein